MDTEYPVTEIMTSPLIRVAYDGVAEAYAAKFFHELDAKPLDRKLLDLFSERVVAGGHVCEVGCGPGEVSVYLAGKGVPVHGIDISDKMVEVARRLSPGLHFEQGDMLALEAGESTLGGLVAFYAIVNLTREEVARAFAEFFRVLRPSAPVLLSFHAGDETLHVTDFLGIPFSIDFVFHPVDAIVSLLKDAGLRVDEVIVRSPYAAVEHPSRRAYIFASKSQGDGRAP